MRVPVLASACLLAASAVIAACGASATPGSAGPSGSPDRAVPGSAAPAIVSQTLDGAAFDLASLRGRPVIVNFWASWCVPCRDEFPLLLSAERAHSSQGLAIVGVLYKDDPAAARGFVASEHADWPSVIDPNGNLASAYTVVAPPQTYFVDRAGVIRSRHIGELLQADLDEDLPAILGS
jgi:cytochrome c biogenesis protein CcmG/thiol:disulfide interchange protein DsbE